MKEEVDVFIDERNASEVQKNLRIGELFHYWLHSLRLGLTNTVCCPVAIGNMYYDCVDDQVEAKKIMRERIRIDLDDIDAHLKLMGEANDQLKLIDSYVMNDKRWGIKESTRGLVGVMRKYSSLVEQHIVKPDPFLKFPYSGHGHIESYTDSEQIRPLLLNQSGTKKGLEIGLSALDTAVEMFSSNTDIPRILKQDAQAAPCGREYLDGRLELVKSMLKRVRE